jgi:mRNA interferase RelE/StbE
MYKIIVPKYALKELSNIEAKNQQLIFGKIKDLENGIFINDKALKGKHQGKFRKRAGNYRIIYLKKMIYY